MDTIILFGAGVYAKKYRALLEYLNMDFDYFADNDASKWGMVLYGKKVIAPAGLAMFPECKIIISSTHEAAIRQQLSEMGMDKNIVGLDVLYDLCEKQMPGEKCRQAAACGMETIFVDMYEGIGWGGTELWAANLAYGMRSAGYKAVLLGGTQQPELERQYEDMVKRIPEGGVILRMVEMMENNLPCIFINNFAGCAFMAASIVKRKYPGLMKIVSVIHNDNKSLFDAHMLMADDIDKVFCVSRQICEHMKEIYDLDLGRCHFKEQPVETDVAWKREVNVSGVVRIGYAARLVRQQKRADLLVNLIDSLEKRGLAYVLQIAGEGECMELIGWHIMKHNLWDKVQLMGRLPKSQMDSFWKRQDIFVNVSEYEGTSLSMLEAMGHGCVPVVTDVSGAREFIEHGKNGYICDAGSMESIAGCIVELAANRELLGTFGESCRKIIEERCNPERYITYWKENVLGEWV